MMFSARLILLALLALFVLCVLLVHLRGRVRLRFDRQLVDHSAVFAPYNLLMYGFSAVPARPILERRGFPQLDLLQANWQTIRDEALRLTDAGHIRGTTRNDDASFNSFIKQGWKRFYLKWYGEPLASAQALCPKTVELLNAIPEIKAAMFATLAPHSKLNPHRDPFAGSLRYHLGLVTPNSRDCRIFVDGEEHAWGDGKDVVFDETFVHWVENTTDQTRVILFADVERPLRTRLMRAINHRVGAFMGKITASPNDDGGAEKTGFVNRMYALSQRKGPLDEWKSGFKRRHRKVYKSAKYLGIVLLLWLLLLAPWPLFR
jgi:beta-hydroxylase